jgi:hypothetical protein
MTEHSIALLVSLAVILVLAILIYVASRGQIAAPSAVCEVRLALQQILANTQKIDNSLRDQRHVLYDAHKRICAVTKGVKKPTPQTQSNQRPDLPDPAVPKGVGCGTAKSASLILQ